MSGAPTRAVVVPSTLLLLPEYAGQLDPVPALRSACRAAAEWLSEGGGEVVVLAADASVGGRIAGTLLGKVVSTRSPSGSRLNHQGSGSRLNHQGSGSRLSHQGGGGHLLVVANGTATRNEKAPGHLDERAHDFDKLIGVALRDGDAAALQNLDADLGRELWCDDVPALQALGAAATGSVEAQVHYADDPFGVQYWVARWSW